MSNSAPVEVAWFAALCDDDYEFLGVADPELASSWEHCRSITLAADRHGFDNILLPSGYTLGIDSTAFAAAVAPLTEQIQLLLAVRMGELWLPQLARQLATIDRVLDGRLTINIISSDIPGQALDSEPRYRRTLEWMQVLRTLLDGQPVDFHGEFVDLAIEPPEPPPPQAAALRFTSEASPTPPRTLPRPRPMCSSPGLTRWQEWPTQLPI